MTKKIKQVKKQAVKKPVAKTAKPKTDKQLLEIIAVIKQAKAVAIVAIDNKDDVNTAIFVKDGKQNVKFNVMAGLDLIKHDILMHTGE